MENQWQNILAEKQNMGELLFFCICKADLWQEGDAGKKVKLGQEKSSLSILLYG